MEILHHNHGNSAYTSKCYNLFALMKLKCSFFIRLSSCAVTYVDSGQVPPPPLNVWKLCDFSDGFLIAF